LLGKQGVFMTAWELAEILIKGPDFDVRLDVQEYSEEVLQKLKYRADV
jgi:hypothetical protein